MYRNDSASIAYLSRDVKPSCLNQDFGIYKIRSIRISIAPQMLLTHVSAAMEDGAIAASAPTGLCFGELRPAERIGSALAFVVRQVSPRIG